jgi:tRNA (guanine-N7-)-methyltransferase
MHCTKLRTLLLPIRPRSLSRLRTISNSSPTASGASRIVAASDIDHTAFAALGIDGPLGLKVAGVRVRQHVNPLKRELQELTPPPDWPAVFDDPSLPLVVDVGAGYGRFLLALKQTLPGYNMLGLEIRGPVIERANKWAEGLDFHRSVLFVMSNATVSLRHMLASYPGPIDLVTIQYPDPHFKKRHRKRRIVQRQLVEGVAALLAPGGRVLLQSDQLEVAEDMRDQFERGGAAAGLAPCREAHAQGKVFLEASPPSVPEEVGEQGGGQGGEESLEWNTAGWLVDNPLGVPTEREVHHIGQGLPVYRVLLRKAV